MPKNMLTTEISRNKFESNETVIIYGLISFDNSISVGSSSLHVHLYFLVNIAK